MSFLQTSGQAEQELVNQVAERWRQAHPEGPKAEFVLATGSVVEKFSAMLAGGTAPALASMSASEGVGFAERGDFVALDDYARRDRYDLADYIPASLDQYRWKGKLYALLRDFSHQSLWVNTDMFARDGAHAARRRLRLHGRRLDLRPVPRCGAPADQVGRWRPGPASTASSSTPACAAGTGSSCGATARSCSTKSSRSAPSTTSGRWRGCS